MALENQNHLKKITIHILGDFFSKVKQRHTKNLGREEMETVKKHVTHAFSGYQLTHKLLNNLQQFEISPTAKLVLLYLTSCYNSKKADVFPKQKTIAQKLGVSERSVVRAVQELVKAGIILVECKCTNRYKFTSKIVSEASENEKNFTPDNMSDNVRQNDTPKRDKLSDTCIQPIKEHIKQPTISVEDYKILKDYAHKHGAKNVNAYINALKKNGSAEEIIGQFRKVQKSSKYMYKLTEQFLQNNRVAREIATKEIPQCFKDLKQVLIERCKK